MLCEPIACSCECSPSYVHWDYFCFGLPTLRLALGNARADCVNVLIAQCAGIWTSNKWREMRHPTITSRTNVCISPISKLVPAESCKNTIMVTNTWHPVCRQNSMKFDFCNKARQRLDFKVLRSAFVSTLPSGALSAAPLVLCLPARPDNVLWPSHGRLV